jgi:hypothetical protein
LGDGCRRLGENYGWDFLAAGEAGFLRHGRLAWYSVTAVALALRRTRRETRHKLPSKAEK